MLPRVTRPWCLNTQPPLCRFTIVILEHATRSFTNPDLPVVVGGLRLAFIANGGQDHFVKSLFQMPLVGAFLLMAASPFVSSIFVVLNLPLSFKSKEIVSLVEKILMFYGGTVTHEQHYG